MDKIVYTIGKSIYLNLTNQCSNDCVFCVRNGNTFNDSDNMWLKREPNSQEIINELKKYNLNQYDEVVFCGFGEPTYKINEIEDIGKFLKDNKIKTRINTNGQGNVINNKDITKILSRYIDVINISLNEVTPEKYQKICKSIYGEDIFNEIIDFIKKCVENKMDVVLSIVDIIDEKSIEEAKKLANKLGARLKIREYIK